MIQKLNSSWAQLLRGGIQPYWEQAVSLAPVWNFEIQAILAY